MPVPRTEFIWMNGEYVKWENAKVHVLSHVLHYGSGWFEGIRCYDTKRGPAIFRLKEHIKRLENSVKIYHAELPYSQKQICDETVELVRKNKLASCYIRPLAYRGLGEMGVNPLGCPMELIIAAWEWGRYLGKEALEEGVDVCVSSWNHLTPNTMPSISKASSNYMNSQLVRLEAVRHGYSEGISLDSYGNLSEGSGENVFLVADGTLITPPAGASLLPGITRDTVIQLAHDLKIPVKEQTIPRAMLYVADEVFMTGTAVEMTPVRSVDRLTVGSGKTGPITTKLMKAFFSVIQDGKDPHGWLTFINSGKKTTSVSKSAKKKTGKK
ncbi:MAG: branched-chain amino acid transaminase [Candidatus Kapabacteria bacterium]|nr:branched-chain amino acid transaminase [Candidatus Kapabacteria bacterium]MBX7153928.1 branched-chain amino acid transaminase [Bacteroidota bacterium]